MHTRQRYAFSVTLENHTDTHDGAIYEHCLEGSQKCIINTTHNFETDCKLVLITSDAV